jgi:hypothetical protein
MKKLRPVFLLAIGALLLAGTLSAQRATGQIFGKVIDDQGAALPGVSIVAKGPRLVGEATAVTNAQGAYRLVALPPGTYDIAYTLAGFKPLVRKDIILGAEQTLTLDITLSPSVIAEQVTVIGQSPLIDVKSTARGAAMNRQVFSLLPKGRNFDSLLVMVPGVSSEPLLAGTSVDGASGAENMWYVDGMSTTNLINGTSGQGVNYDFVEEVNFKSSGYNAEYGGSLGGVVNVLTRSGGNAYHGEILAYYNDEALTARRRDVLYYDNNDLNRNTSAKFYSWDKYYGVQNWNNIEAGLNLGGYILKDRIWFFGSAIPNYNHYTRTLDYRIQNLTTPARDVHYRQVDWNGQAKISAQPFKNLRVSAGIINNLSVQRGQLPASYNASTTVDYDSYGFNYPNMSTSVTADWIVTNNFMVSARGGFFRTNQNNQLPPTGLTEPVYIFQMEQPYSYAATTNVGLLDVPVSYQHPANWQNQPLTNLNATKRVIRQKYNANLDLTYFANLGGEHAFKIGGQYIRQGENVDSSATVPLIYLGWDNTFSAYGVDYGRGTYGWYAVRGNDLTGPYGSFYNAQSDQWAFYAQDSWTIARKLTINAGVRTESEYIPSYSQNPLYQNIRPIKFPFNKKISPRFGFVYDWFGDSSLKVYASFAIYQDVMKLDLAANSFGGFQWKSTYYSLDTYQFDTIGVNGNYPGTNYVTLDFRAPSFDTVQPNMHPFTQREIAFGVDKKLFENFSVSLRVVNKSVLWAIEDMGLVLPSVGEYYFEGNPGGAFINSKYAIAKASVDEYGIPLLPAGVPDMPKAKREYWAVSLGGEKRLANNWLMGFSATWSSLRGNYSGLASADEAGRLSPNTERAFDLWQFQFDKQLNPIDGPLPTDRPLIFKFYGSYVFPMGLTVGTVMQAMSGTPLSTAWNVSGPGYYPFNRGDLGRTPFLYYADGYAEYNWRLGGRYALQFSVNVSNMFNVETPTNFNQTPYRTDVTPVGAPHTHPTYDEILLTKTWQPLSTARLDGRFGFANTFFAPLQARLGVKFSF